jgi:hypothetical protein
MSGTKTAAREAPEGCRYFKIVAANSKYLIGPKKSDPFALIYRIFIQILVQGGEGIFQGGDQWEAYS